MQPLRELALAIVQNSLHFSCMKKTNKRKELPTERILLVVFGFFFFCAYRLTRLEASLLFDLIFFLLIYIVRLSYLHLQQVQHSQFLLIIRNPFKI